MKDDKETKEDQEVQEKVPETVKIGRPVSGKPWKVKSVK